MQKLHIVEWFQSFTRPVIIAHRGASAYFPENTLPAIEAAIEYGSDMVEVDIRMTADGVPVISHDSNLQRTANRKENIADLTWKQLQQVDVGSWFHSRYDELRVLSLRQFLEVCEGQIPANLEIKFHFRESPKLKDALKMVMEELAYFKMEDQVVISGFNRNISAIVKSLKPEVASAVLHNPLQWKRVLPSRVVKNYNADFFHCSWRQFGKSWQQDLQKHHIPINVYTVNQTVTYMRMRELGVCGVFTDRPDMLLKLEKSLQKPHRSNSALSES